MLCFFRVKIRLGDLDLNETVVDESEPLDIDVDTFVWHEQFRSKINDIAIVKMKRKVSFTGTFKSAWSIFSLLRVWFFRKQP